MDIKGKVICGICAENLRDLFKFFLEMETESSIENGEFKYAPKSLNIDFIKDNLNIENQEAKKLHDCLISNNYIEEDKLVPTSQGMALAHASSLDRISLNEAKDILNKFINKVKDLNQKEDARVLVSKVFLFGSVHAEKPDVGDIDLLIEFSRPDDLQPEDVDEEDEIIEAISISPYLSFHDEFDQIVLQADKHEIYKNQT